MPDDRAHGADRGGHRQRCPRKLETRAETSRRNAMSRGVECHDAITTREERAAEIHEAGAAAAPAVDDQYAGTAIAPRPCRDTATADGQIKAPSCGQPCGHPFTDRAARRRAEQALRPPRGKAG